MGLAMLPFFLLCTISKVLATLDIPSQLYPNKLVESDSHVGTFIPLPKFLTGPIPGTAKEIKLACLNTYLPPPFDYVMRCPNTAKIYEWTDKFGAYHRRNEHEPIPGVTSRMMKWFLSPNVIILSPIVNCRGKHVYWYKCWHPVDHVGIVPYPGVSANSPKLPGIFIRVWEHYRKLPNETVKEFELNMLLGIPDPSFTNFQFQIPFVIPGLAPGIVLGSFNSYYEDTPQGLKVITEMIVGSDTPVINIAANLISIPTLRNQLYGLADQLSRHNIEEFGNLQYFLPQLYQQYRPWDKQG